MFFEPNRTSFDLNFRLFGINIRIHPLFWLFSALIGFGSVQQYGLRAGMPFLLIWIACVFVSILIHELGHVWMGQVFGNHGHIVIYSFGGLAIGSNASSTWWKRVLVSFAGPLAGFILLGLLIVILRVVSPGRLFDNFRILFGIFGIQSTQLFPYVPYNPNPYLDRAILNLFYINFFWGVLNLLPIFPLDGGQISRDFLSQVNPRSGYKISLLISAIVAGLLAVHSFMYYNSGKGLIPFLQFGSNYTAFMFAILAFQSFMQLQQQHHTDPYDPWMGERRPWER